MSDLPAIISAARAAIDAAADATALDLVRVQYLGKKGQLTDLLKALGKLPADERPAAGQKINEAKQKVSESIEARKRVLAEADGPPRPACPNDDDFPGSDEVLDERKVLLGRPSTLDANGG